MPHLVMPHVATHAIVCFLGVGGGGCTPRHAQQPSLFGGGAAHRRHAHA